MSVIGSFALCSIALGFVSLLVSFVHLPVDVDEVWLFSA